MPMLVVPYIDVVDELLLLTQSHQKQEKQVILQKNNKSFTSKDKNERTETNS